MLEPEHLPWISTWEAGPTWVSPSLVTLMFSFQEEFPKPPVPVLEQGHTKPLQKEEEEQPIKRDTGQSLLVPLDKPFQTSLRGR